MRTAIGTYGGTLKDIAAPALGAAVVRESLERSGLAAAKVQQLIMGNVIQAGVKMNPARQAGAREQPAVPPGTSPVWTPDQTAPFDVSRRGIST